MFQLKEQNKTSEKELNKMETDSLPEAEFKTLIIRMLSDGKKYFMQMEMEKKTGLTILTLYKIYFKTKAITRAKKPKKQTNRKRPSNYSSGYLFLENPTH